MYKLYISEEEKSLLKALDLYLLDNKEKISDYKKQQDTVDCLKAADSGNYIIDKILNHLDILSTENDVLRNELTMLKTDVKGIVNILSDTHRSVDRSMLTTLENRYRYF